MGRPRTINVNRDELLAGIDKALQADIAVLEAELSDCLAERETHTYSSYRIDQTIGTIRREIEYRRVSGWVAYNVERFADRELTPSEKIRHQQSLRSMEQAGLVELSGIRATLARLTDTGLTRVQAMQATATLD
jgi:hypothetical protein